MHKIDIYSFDAHNTNTFSAHTVNWKGALYLGGKFPQMGHFYKIFPKLGSFSKILRGGVVFHVNCMGNIANRHCQWRVCWPSPTWQGKRQWWWRVHTTCKSPALLASLSTGKQTANQTGGFAFVGLACFFRGRFQLFHMKVKKADTFFR